MIHDILGAKAAILHEFPQRHVVVFGDVMLDQYVFGSVSRISPEAPVPVLKKAGRTFALGGAANVAKNLAALGLSVDLVGCLGDDAEAGIFRKALCDDNISDRGLTTSLVRCTITKLRLMAGDRQLIRLDDECDFPVSGPDLPSLMERFKSILGLRRPDAVVISDYAKGVCSSEACQEVIGTCRSQSIPVFVDPKGKDYDKYSGASAIKPNRLELEELASALGWPKEEPIEVGQRLRERLDLDFVACTLGADGIGLVLKDRVYRLPTVAREVFDVSGAGDTVMATLVAGITSGVSLLDSTALANLAAADVIARVGTAAITKESLLLALQTQGHSTARRKICEREDLELLVSAWKSQKLIIAFTNGCFDLLHPGHVNLLEQAAAKADKLIVAINSDESVRRLKGPGRPVTVARDRAAVLSALESVDAVVIFDEDTPTELLRSIRPDVLAKGNDYLPEQVVGGEFVLSYGGTVSLVPIDPDRSSSQIIERIANPEFL